MHFSGAGFLDRLNMFSIKLGLEPTLELFARAGDPQKKLRFIHLAGTNGKGSTGAMLEAALRGAGFHTGFYTSPHLIDVRERFRIDGKMVDPPTFDRAAEILAKQTKGMEFTYFEFATALAAKIFVEADCDIVIWETGMGGRLDATNVVKPIVSVITNIALDHQQILGGTLELIAREKAGIIKENIPVFTGKLPPEAYRVIAGTAKEKHADFFPPAAPVPEKFTIDADGNQCFTYDGIDVALSLPGRMQRENCRIVLAVLRYLAEKEKFDLRRAVAALSHVRWPGRMQTFHNVIIDGGHNPDGVGALTTSLAERFPKEKFTVVYGGFEDKAAAECLKLWAPLAEKMIFTPLPAEKRTSFPPEKLEEMLFEIAPEIPSCGASGGIDALKKAQASAKGKIVVSGSLFLAGEILEYLGGKEAAGNLA